MNRRTRAADVLVPVAILLAGCGYFYAFHRLGWFLQDEGVLYYHYFRVYQGQLPYRDFFTGYGPIVYYLQAWAFSLFGVSINATRVLMGAVNSLTAVGLYLIARRVAGRGFAIIPAALFLAMHPADTAVMIFHNSPYASWYALTFTVFATWAVLRALEAASRRREVLWFLASGFLGGLAFLSKQNAGIFFLWGASGFLVSYADPGVAPRESEPVILRAARLTYLALILGAVVALIRSYLDPTTFVLFVVPVVGLVVVGAQRHLGREAWQVLLARLLWVGIGVVVAVTPWLLYFTAQMGLGLFLHAVFFVGADVDLNLYVPFPGPQIPALLILTPLAVAGILLRPFATRIEGKALPPAVRRLRLVAALGVLAMGAAIFAQTAVLRRLLHFDYNLWQIYSASSTAVDNVVACGAVVVLLGGLAVAARQGRSGRREEDDPPPAAFLCLLWIATCTFIGYYPRMDYAHLMSAVPLVYVVGAGLLGRLRASVGLVLGRRWQRPANIGFGIICGLVTVFVVSLKTAPKIYSQVMLAPGGHGLVPTPQVRLQFERADLYFPIYLERSRLHNQAFGDLISYLNETTPAGEPIFAFPALPMVYFISGHDNVTRHDYFLGENVSFSEQLEVIRTLERTRMRTVVTANDPTEYFVMKGRPFTRLIWEYLNSRYYRERRIGPYDVMRRYGSEQKAASSTTN